MSNENFSYDGVAVECQPVKVSVRYDPSHWGVSKEEAGFLELAVAEAQTGRLEKRHASATDHADNICH